MALLLKILPDPVRRRFNCWRYERFELGRDIRGSSLAAFDYYHCIFVHIPKTGGVSVSDALFGHLAGVHKTMQDYEDIFGRKTLAEYYKFTVVRNPWDRLVSAYTFLKAGGLHQSDARWAEKHLGQYEAFEDFVMDWLTPENIRKGIHFVPQADFLTIDGRLAVDFIGRFESLEADFGQICTSLGRPGLALPHKNKSVRKDYRDYYSAGSRDRVAQVYAVDIEHLGYSFT